MPTLINFKICDNSPECGGIAVCPTKAMYFDQEKKSIVIDNDKCISCGLCRPQCPVSAIYVAKTKEEFEQLKRDVDNDPRTVKDLFVDRYGATPISDFFVITPQQLKEKVKNKGITSLNSTMMNRFNVYLNPSQLKILLTKWRKMLHSSNLS